MQVILEIKFGRKKVPQLQLGKIWYAPIPKVVLSLNKIVTCLSFIGNIRILRAVIFETCTLLITNVEMIKSYLQKAILY